MRVCLLCYLCFVGYNVVAFTFGFLSLRCSLWELVIDILASEENRFEFVEAKHTITSLVMLLDHCVDLLTADVSAELLHGKYDVLFSNLT